MKRSRLLAKRWLVLAGTAGIALASAPGAPGYKFLRITHHDPRMSIPRWDPEVWPGGGTLSFQFVDSPDWALASGLAGTEDAKGIASEALAAWNATPSADIRWDVGKTVPPEESEVGTDNAIQSVGLLRASAEIWGSYVDGEFVIQSCRIKVPALLVWNEDDLFATIAHEAGHCLGLDHPAAYPRRASDYSEALDRDGLIDARRGLWPIDPLMTYGRTVEPFLTVDDRVGASLIRPRPGWKGTTGTITGAVFSDLDPAPFVNVLAIRVCAGGRLCDGVGAVTGPTGGFAVEGLPPGRYILWVHPLKVPSAILGRDYWEIGATHVEDTVLTRPVEVRADTVTGPLFVGLRPHEGGPR